MPGSVARYESDFDCDLDAIVYPCPKGGLAQVERRGGKRQFPYLVDENAGVEMYESDDIVRHLWQRYGTGGAGAFSRPAHRRVGVLARRAPQLWSVYRPAKSPEKPPTLELRGFTLSASFARRSAARNSLLLHNVQGSPRRDPSSRDRAKMLPYLVDPNQGVRCSSPPTSSLQADVRQ